ncbi:MAG: DUF4040 domain-containing protein [Thiotrichales bacterium]|nr:DUF4040 domain-containing protein [Thiotrichales bacterium]
MQMLKTDASPVRYVNVWLWLAMFAFALFSALIFALLQIELPWRLTLPWIPSLGIELRFRVDAFSALMILLITGIGSMVFLYSAGYFKHTPDHQRLLITLPLFMLAMIGVVSSDDIILLFVFWELTSITSFLMVGFKHQDPKARYFARQALFVSMGGGMALLGGLIIMGQLANSWSLTEIIQAAPGFIDHPALTIAIILILLGTFTKSAQFPFHFWLPNAMAAPTPVSAYLHSATMVKLGIYLMARFDTAFNYVLLWEVLLISTGMVTAIWAALLALRERDLKRILARTTLSALGILTLLIGLPSPNAGLAVVAFLFAHAVYKAPLFMVAGNIDHATGTRIIDDLRGLRKKMPFTAAAAIIAGLSMAGLPLAYGFVAKDMVSAAKDQSDLILFASYGLMFVNAAAIAVAAVAAIRIFWGPIKQSMEKVKEVPWTMFVPPLILVIFGIEFDALPNYRDPLLLSAAQSISPALSMSNIETEYSSDLLVATSVTLFIGIVLFMAWDKIHDGLQRIKLLNKLDPEIYYDKSLKGLQWLAAKHTQTLQNGFLSHYLTLTLISFLLFASYLFINSKTAWQFQFHFPEQAVYWAVAAALMAIAAFASLRLKNNLATLMASGIVGYGAAILFLFSGAPDLAFTQFMMETILVVVIASSLPLFKHSNTLIDQGANFSRVAIALLSGAGMFVLLLAMPLHTADPSVANWLSSNSLPLANGHNVVNVIIVDFRALDTFGEIVVVVFSLIAAIPLLKQLAQNQQANAFTSQPANPQSFILEKMALPIYWLLFVASLIVVLRGHNDPGGGFIGGLMAVAASSWLAIQHSPKLALKLQVLDPVKLALLGVALALLSGLIGLFASGEFLQHYWAGGLSTVILFDIGVFLAVWGGLSGYVYGLVSAPAPQASSEQTEARTPIKTVTPSSNTGGQA